MLARIRSPILIATLGLACCATACDSAFRSRSIVSGSSADFSFQFPGGTTQTTLKENEVLELEFAVPTTGFDRLLAGGAIVDSSRLVVQSTPDLTLTQNHNLLPDLLANELVTVGDPVEGAVPLTITLPLIGVFEFPVGLLLLEAFVIDDNDESSETITLELTVLAVGRPTVRARLEQPPVNGVLRDQLLPTNPDGDFFIGETLPFALVLNAIPDEETGSGFERVWDGAQADPTRLIVTADRDLGDAGGEFFPAGTNLAPLFGREVLPSVDGNNGELVIAASFPRADPLVPAQGITQFTAEILDDSDIASDPQTIELAVEPVVPLSGPVQTVFQNGCAFSFCHGDESPAFGLDLSTAERSFTNLVGVEADGVADGSCAPLRVQPYDLDASYLMHKLLDTHRDGCVMGSGDIMPLGGPGLPQDELDAVAAWIRQGGFDG